MDYYKNRHAIVTGASGGLGKDFATELAKRGCSRLTLVARSGDKLAKLAATLREEHKLAVEVLVKDLSKPGAAAAAAEAAAQHAPVDLVINNAGFGSNGRFEEQSLEAQLMEVRLNVLAVMELTHAVLPGMRERGFGGILNVASTAAFQPLPYMATYGASKSFVLSFTEALWAENRDRGVHVTALCPGPTATGFFQRMGDDLPAILGPYKPSLPVACDGLDALASGRSAKVSGARNFLMTQAPRLVPRQMMAAVSEKMMASKRDAAKAKPGTHEARRVKSEPAAH